MEAAAYSPRTVEEVFRDFKGRRAAMIKALTTVPELERWRTSTSSAIQLVVMEDFRWKEHGDLAEKENLCLYGFPTETWEVGLPAEEVPPELPEPALGINFARDGMQEKDWLSLVAVHSDAWLLAVAFYFGARFGFDRNDSSHDADVLDYWSQSRLSNKMCIDLQIAVMSVTDKFVLYRKFRREIIWSKTDMMFYLIMDG
ncbi:PHD finger protein ALFIN-LIKE 4 [Nymphaea thermarum]|nr:PHD finger protein ALFIN-LIKE 4 [Nymphaea thermarum]